MASRSHKEFLSILISLCGADANQRDGNGCTALFFIVTLGYAECMEKLLSCGGLTDAVMSERRDLVRWWLKLDGDKGDKVTQSLVPPRNIKGWPKSIKIIIVKQ